MYSLFDKSVYGSIFSWKPLEGRFKREQVPFLQELCIESLSLIELGHKKIYFTMSVAYASHTVFLCLHLKEPKMSYGAATKYNEMSKTFINKWMKRYFDVKNVDLSDCGSVQKTM